MADLESTKQMFALEVAPPTAVNGSHSAPYWFRWIAGWAMLVLAFAVVGVNVIGRGHAIDKTNAIFLGVLVVLALVILFTRTMMELAKLLVSWRKKA